MAGRVSAAHIAEMQRQMRYEKRRPYYYKHLSEKYAMVSDHELAHRRAIDWAWGWALFAAIILFVVVSLVFSIATSDLLYAGLSLLLACVLCAAVTSLLMEKADEMRRRALVKWRTMMVDETARIGG